jgi:ATP adenylyltransferase
MHRHMEETGIQPYQDTAANMGRFATILSASHGCARPLYDEVLFEIEGCVITPTLGSIVPYWLLVIPRTPSVNFAQWQSEIGLETHELVSRVLAHCSIASSRAFWFEHGAAHRGSPVSCGVDHAHLHIIIDAPFSFDEFTSSAVKSAPISWQRKSVDHAYRDIRDGTSYLFAASSERGMLAEHVDYVGSQFFRRVIADLIGQPQCWNYKTHAYIENIRKTVRTFAS